MLNRVRELEDDLRLLQQKNRIEQMGHHVCSETQTAADEHGIVNQAAVSEPSPVADKHEIIIGVVSTESEVQTHVDITSGTPHSLLSA